MLLASVYELHDIDDVEALCVRGARRWCEKTGTRLSAADFESLVSFLLVACWRMSQRYDRERSSSFRAVVIGRLGNRCTDWLRSHRGRTRWKWHDHEYVRERPVEVSLDAPAWGNDGDTLGASLSSGDGDPAPGGGPLTLEGYSQTEIATRLGIQHWCVPWLVERFKNELEQLEQPSSSG